MSVDQLLSILWKRRLSLVTTFVLTMVAAALVTFSLPKVYSTTAFLWVNPASQAGSDFEATQLSQVLSRSYAELLQTDAVASQVADRLPFRESSGKVQSDVDVKPVTQSQLLQVTAEGSSPRRARIVANTYAQVFIERARQLDTRGVTSSRVSLAESATNPGSASRPKPRLYLAIGAVVALLAAALVALVRERLDQRLQLDSSSTELFGLPIIGRIPRVPPAELEAGAEHLDPAARTLDDALRLLLTNLSFVHHGLEPATLAVVSPSQGEGKSTCAVNLARVAMGLGMEVLVVDADLRRPSVMEGLGLDDGDGLRPGLANFLVRTRPIDEILVRVPRRPLSAVPSGPTPPNPTALLRMPALAEFDRQVKERFDMVIYDTPPLSTGADASLVAVRAEAVLLVVDVDRTRRSSAVRAIDQLERTHASVSGIVVNRVREQVTSSYYRREGDGRAGRRAARAETAV